MRFVKELSRFYEDFNFLTEKKANFVVKKTRKTKRIEHEGTKTMYGIDPKEPDFKHFLPLYTQVHTDAEGFLSKNTTVKPLHTDYYGWMVHRIQPYIITLYKLDISAAYWNLGFHKFFSEGTYRYGLDKKNIRLKALGSLATTSETQRYVKGMKEGEPLVKYNEQKAWLYKSICFDLDYLMRTLMSLFPEICGYWTDCLFTKSLDNIDMYNEVIKDFTRLYPDKEPLRFKEPEKHEYELAFLSFENQCFYPIGVYGKTRPTAKGYWVLKEVDGEAYYHVCKELL